MATEGEAKMQRLEATVAKLEDLVKGLAAWKASAEATRQREAARPAASSGGVLLPNYGRSKGLPVEGASLQDLEFYANGARRSLSDPAKSRWHDKEAALLAAIEAEIARQGNGGMPPPSDDDAPPPSDESTPF